MNPVLKYTELDSTPFIERAPIRFFDNLQGNLYFQGWAGSTIPGASLPSSSINNPQDMFVIDIFGDGSLRPLMLGYGFDWKGTYAAGKYFDIVIYPNLRSFNVSWIIVKWVDTNGNGFVNNPGDGDSYSVVAAGECMERTVYVQNAVSKPHTGTSWFLCLISTRGLG